MARAPHDLCATMARSSVESVTEESGDKDQEKAEEGQHQGDWCQGGKEQVARATGVKAGIDRVRACRPTGEE